MGAGATSMDNTLRDTFVVEAVDLLASHMVLEEHRTSLALTGDLEPVIGVGLSNTIVGCYPVIRILVAEMTSQYELS